MKTGWIALAESGGLDPVSLDCFGPACVPNGVVVNQADGTDIQFSTVYYGAYLVDTFDIPPGAAALGFEEDQQPR